MNQNKTPNNREDKANKILTVIGAVLCVILIPILIVNCTLIVKSLVNKEDVPDFGGFLPLIVLTDSMYPEIKSGDLIFCKTVEAEEVNEGDVISFFDPAGNGSAVVTHKVERIEKENGKLSFVTKGINNNTEDRLPVPADNLVGKYIEHSGAYSLRNTSYGCVCGIRHNPPQNVRKNQGQRYAGAYGRA